ncbi:MAG TPA: PhzF family phenazine biosynthesis protein [Pirellulales bacterium]
MPTPVFHVDAFSDHIFGGNPAAICPLDNWPGEETLQAIAAEHNLSETAYLRQVSPGRYELRWFTPAVEVDLCGHATLAAALIVFAELEPDLADIAFETRSGQLKVRRVGDRLAMDFPSRRPVPCEPPHELIAGLGANPATVLKSRDFLAVYASEDAIRELQPDFSVLKRLPSLGVIVTAPGKNVDFVSRFFAPQAGINEDPVTGSAHSTLTPYWAERLGKSQLHARQISTRGGELWCSDFGDRVEIAGHAVLFSRGMIHL